MTQIDIKMPYLKRIGHFFWMLFGLFFDLHHDFSEYFFGSKRNKSH